MQVLWSRAQARATCRCGSCLHAAIARRTTIAAGRRRLKVSDLFTACYSTILATAALADAKVKEDRRKEWDRVIAEAKAGIPNNEPDYVQEVPSQPRSESLGLNSSSNGQLHAQGGLSKTSWGGNGWAIPSPRQHTSLETRLRVLDAQLREVSTSPDSRAEQEVTAWTPLETEPENEWVGEEYDADLPPREPKNDLHLRKMEDMIAKLVGRLLLQTSIYSAGSTSAIVPSDIQEQIDMAQRIEALRKGFTQLPAYRWDDMDSVQAQRTALHQSLTALCDRSLEASKPSIDLMLAKICYNLLICTAPPNILTYNILLNTFNRLRQTHLNEIVIESYFYESRLKLSKNTCRLMLDHYRIKKDPDGFNTILKRMGGYGKSMRIRRRHTNEFWREHVKDWALSKKVILRESYLYQKMPRGEAIFESLVRGSLQFMSVRSAIRYVRAAFREGCGVTSETLCKVISRCLAEFDFVAAISLLRAILGWSVSYDVPPAYYSKVVRSHVYRLLSLCGINPTLGSQQILPLRLSKDALEQILRHMRIQSIAESVERFGQRIMSLEYVFCDIEAEYATSIDQVSQALALLEIADGFERKRAKHRHNGKAGGRWARICSLESMLDLYAAKVKARQMELLPLAAARLNWKQKNKYFASVSLLEQRGLVVEPSERLSLLFRVVQLQDRGKLQMIKARRLYQSKAKSTGGAFPASDTLVPKQPSLLIPYFPANKLGSETASVRLVGFGHG